MPFESFFLQAPGRSARPFGTSVGGNERRSAPSNPNRSTSRRPLRLKAKAQRKQMQRKTTNRGKQKEDKRQRKRGKQKEQNPTPTKAATCRTPFHTGKTARYISGLHGVVVTSEFYGSMQRMLGASFCTSFSTFFYF